MFCLVPIYCAACMRMTQDQFTVDAENRFEVATELAKTVWFPSSSKKFDVELGKGPSPQSQGKTSSRSPTAPSVLPMQTSGPFVLAGRNIGQNVRTALHLGGGGIGDRHIEKIFNFEEQSQFIQRVEPQIF